MKNKRDAKPAETSPQPKRLPLFARSLEGKRLVVKTGLKAGLARERIGKEA